MIPFLSRPWRRRRRASRPCRLLARYALFASLALLLAGACTRHRPASTEARWPFREPHAGGTLRISLAREPAPLSPLLGRRGRAIDLWSCFYPSLFTCEPQGAKPPLVRGDLARRSEWSEENRSLTVVIRTDRYWQDTTRVRASDVVRTYDAYRAMGRLPSGAVSDSVPDTGLISVTAENDSTLHLGFRPGFTLWRAWPAATWPILPASKLADLRPSMLEMSPLSREPLSAGPFRLLEWRPGLNLWLGPNPMAPSGSRPWVNKVALERSPGPDSRILRVALGRADVALDVPVFRLASLVDRDVAVQAHQGPVASVEMLFWNLGLFAPPALRQAVSLAVDRERLVQLLLTWRGQRYGGAAGGLLEPAGPAVVDSSIADAPIPIHDSAKADSVLDAAGWSERDAAGYRLRSGMPLRIEMVYDRSNEFREKIATLLEEDLHRVGILLELVPLDGPVLWERFRSGLFETALVGFRPPEIPDLSALWGTHGLWNAGGYASAQADSLVGALKSASKPEDIERCARRLEAQIRRDRPVTFLIYRQECDLLSPRVRDFQGSVLSPLGRLERVWLADTTESGTDTPVTAKDGAGATSPADRSDPPAPYAKGR
jgi:peptide/nickel transport system substrate-binding protein